MATIGGTTYAEINGRQRSYDGEIEIDPGGITREQITDTNGESVGHTEKFRNTSFEITFYMADGLLQKEIEAWVDKPIQFRCVNGRTLRHDKVTCAQCNGVNMHKGTLKASFFAPGRMLES